MFDLLTRKNLNMAFLKNPPVYAANLDEVIEYLNHPTKCYIGLDFHLAKPLIEAKFCNLMFLEFYPIKIPYSYYTSKNFSVHREVIFEKRYII